MNDTTLPAPSIQRPDATLADEHAVLLRHLAAAQLRCSEAMRQQAGEIAQLRAQAMKMRAAIIARDSALAWACEDRAALEAAIPDLAPRVTLARKVKDLSRRLQDLMRDTLRPTISAAVPAARPQTAAGTATPDIAALEASIVAADLVICQTGCLSHGAYWRVQDHCKRTGKTCVMVEQPANFRVMRIHHDMRTAIDGMVPAETESAQQAAD